MRETTDKTPTTDQGWLGQEMVDQKHNRIGRVVDVIYDTDTDPMPDWAVVNAGMFAGAHYVPLGEAYRTRDGRLVVPYDKTTVRRSPRADRSHILTPDVRRVAGHHYGG